jgi:hypothetical protein
MERLATFKVGNYGHLNATDQYRQFYNENQEYKALKMQRTHSFHEFEKEGLNKANEADHLLKYRLK